MTAGEIQAHGALVEVLGVGVLLVGPSGIGKSESALDLVQRGHALVADDVVRIAVEDGRLRGHAPEVTRHYTEIRGLGLLYLPDLYGSECVREEGPVDLWCELEEWREGAEFERVGFERPLHELAGVRIPAVRLPARPAGSVATLVEAAARDHRLRRAGGRAGANRFEDHWLRGRGAR